MSWRAWSDDGFGIEIVRLKDEDKLKEGIRTLLEYADMKDDFFKALEEEPDKDWEELLNEFAEDQGNVYGNGIGYLIAEAMNMKEGIDVIAYSVDDYNNCYVGIAPSYPFHQIDPNKWHTKDWFIAKFKEYASYVLKDMYDADYFSAYYSG